MTPKLMPNIEFKKVFRSSDKLVPVDGKMPLHYSRDYGVSYDRQLDRERAQLHLRDIMLAVVY